MGAREPWVRRPRNLEGAWFAIDDIRERIDRMQIADEVAARVKEELESHRKLALTGVQKVIGTVIGLATLGELALQIHRAIH